MGVTQHVRLLSGTVPTQLQIMGSICKQNKKTTNCVAWISNRVQMPGSSKAKMLLASIADMNNSLRSLADTITPTDKQSFHDHTATAVAALRFLHGIYSQGQTEPAEVQRVPRLGTEDTQAPQHFRGCKHPR